jgi:hypothetical protein
MRLGSILVGAVIVTLAVGTPRSEILIGAQAGGGYLRLGELEDFWDEAGVNYDSNDQAFQWEIAGTWRFARRHAVRLSVERITTLFAVHVAAVGPFGAAFLYSDLEFETIPVCIGYEFTLRRSEHRALTLAGLGVGYYVSELGGEEVFYEGDPVVAYTRHDARDGDGYGFHGYLRQTAPISDRLSLSGMLRGRWADAMAFDDNEGDIPVDFTGFDVALGLDWEF